MLHRLGTGFIGCYAYLAQVGELILVDYLQFQTQF